MFTVRRVITVEYRCPNGHPLELPVGHLLRFCYRCGLAVEAKNVPYDAPYCADCNSPVDPNWSYCPYCGRGREGQYG
jgi:hypothetical protein